MARGKRRAAGDVLGFIEGFNQGYRATGDAVSTYQNAKIAKENPEEFERFSDEQAAQFMASDGSDTVAPQKQYKFLGKTYDKPLSESEIGQARMNAMAGVYQKTGQQEKAIDFKNRARQSELADLQFGAAKRADAKSQRDDADEEVKRNIEKSLGSYVSSNTQLDANGRVIKAPSYLDTSKHFRDLLLQNGRTKDAMEAHKEFTSAYLKDHEMNKIGREQAVDAAVAAVQKNGDWKLAENVYKGFPDGYGVSNTREQLDPATKKMVVIGDVTGPGGKVKQGVILGDRETLLREIIASKDASSMAAHLDNQFMRTMRERELAQGEKRIEQGERGLKNDERRIGLQGAGVALAREEHKERKDEKTVARGKEWAVSTALARMDEAKKKGDAETYQKFKIQAIENGWKPAEAKNEFAYVPNPLGGGVLVDKNEGSGRFVDSAGKVTGEIAAPGAKPAAQAPAPQKGEEAVLNDGPNKGKKVLFDGTKWVIVR